MKVNKLKKSLSINYLVKTSLNAPFFIICEKNSNVNLDTSYTFLKMCSNNFNFPTLKYPLSVIFITELSELSEFKLPFTFVNFKELYFKTQSSVILNALNGLNSSSSFDQTVLVTFENCDLLLAHVNTK